VSSIQNQSSTCLATKSLVFNPAASGPPPVTFYLLQEDGGSRIILEGGSGLLVLEH
jgi:hypothetical protein